MFKKSRPSLNRKNKCCVRRAVVQRWLRVVLPKKEYVREEAEIYNFGDILFVYDNG